MKLFKSKNKKVLAGLCAGLGEASGINPWFFRLLFIMMLLVGGFGILIYWLLIFSLSYKGDPNFDKPRYGGLCYFLSKKTKLDLSVIRVITCLLIFSSGFFLGIGLYFLLSILIKRV